MGLREKLNQNKSIVLGLVILILAVAMLSVFLSRGEDGPQPPRPKLVWYYDLETQTLFADSADRIPPFTNEQGHESVLATVLTCGGTCENGDLNGKSASELPEMGLQLGYLQRLTPSARQSIEDLGDAVSEPGQIALQVRQRLVFEGEFRLPEEPTWRGMRDPMLNRVIEKLRQECQGRPEPCYPGLE